MTSPYGSENDTKKRLAAFLLGTVEEVSLKEFALVTEQHRWVVDGACFLAESGYVHCHKMRIRVLPTRIRSTREKHGDRFC